MRYGFFLLFICLTVFISGCSEDILSPDDYIIWIQNSKHGLKIEKEFNKIVFSLQYQPAAYNAVLEYKKDRSERLDSLIAERQDLQYFSFRMMSKEGKLPVMKTGALSQEEYMMRQQYAALEIEKDFRLVDGQDTLACALFNAEQNYNAAPYADFVMAFPRKKGSAMANDKVFIYSDKIFDIGVVSFRVSAAAVKNIPKLKFEKDEKN